MPLAADYPLLEIFWTIALIALWILWIWLVVWTLIDNFNRDDHGGWAKAGWTLFMIVVPLLGKSSHGNMAAAPTAVPCRVRLGTARSRTTQ